MWFVNFIPVEHMKICLCQFKTSCYRCAQPFTRNELPFMSVSRITIVHYIPLSPCVWIIFFISLTIQRSVMLGEVKETVHCQDNLC
jgi:hypothetical protein